MIISYIKMLLNLKVSNFRSFKEEINFSMIASKDNTLEENLMTLNNLRLKKNAFIFGSNGSGKSNLVISLAFIQYMILNSKSFKVDREILEFPFKLDSKYREEIPMSFEINFLKSNKNYRYYFEIKNSKNKKFNFTILKERLFIDEKLEFEFISPNNKENKYANAKLKKDIEKRAELEKNENMLLISYLYEKNYSHFDEFIEWFRHDLKVLVRYGRGVSMVSRINLASNFEDNELKSEVFNLLKNFSFDKIQNIKLDKVERSPPEFVKKMILENDDLDEEEKFTQLEKISTKNKIFLSHMDNFNNEILFDLDKEESLGTNTLIKLLTLLVKTLKKNGVLVIDEIEDSIHPYLLKKVVDLINEKENKIQLIASTHAYPLLLYVNSEEEQIFRRDQIYFTRLKEDQSTQLYSLMNIGGIRKDLKIFRAYFDGRLDAFPNIKNE